SVYWVNTALMYGGTSAVRKVDLDGSNPMDVWPGSAYSVFVTSTNAYWSDQVSIWRGGLDGQNPTRFTPGNGSLMVAAGSSLYWAGSTGNRAAIFAAPLTGGASRVLVNADAIALVGDASFLYFTARASSGQAKDGVMRLAK